MEQMDDIQDDLSASQHQADRAFVERVTAGDREAAELLLYRCQIWTGQLARRSAVPTQEWGEIANEALLTALGQMRRGLFRGDCSFQTWLETIIRGKIADYWRARGKHQALVPLEAPPADYADSAKAISLIQTLATQKIDHELRLAVRAALRALPHQHAMILILNVREGYSTAELGQLLALPQGTVGRKLAEAKKLFRRIVCDLEIVGKAAGKGVGEAAEAQGGETVPDGIMKRWAVLSVLTRPVEVCIFRLVRRIIAVCRCMRPWRSGCGTRWYLVPSCARTT